MVKPNGLVYWLRWIDSLKKWLDRRPAHLELDEFFTMEDVAYQDLADLSKHFQIPRKKEDYKHRQSVEVELADKVSVTFYSTPRSFTYDDLHIGIKQ